MKAGRQWHKLHPLAWEADLHVDASPVDKCLLLKTSCYLKLPLNNHEFSTKIALSEEGN
jgi:hypothetical protein